LQCFTDRRKQASDEENRIGIVGVQSSLVLDYII
jgi:hypothetical protein